MGIIKLRKIIGLFIFLFSFSCISIFFSSQVQASPQNSKLIPTMFNDLSDQDQAYSSVWKLLTQGVLRNESNLSFDAGKAVTKQEAIMLAIRWSGLEDEAKKRSSSVVLPFEVSPATKPYVILAFEKNFITFSEEMQQQDSKKTLKTWGQTAVTYEWFALLMDRICGKNYTSPTKVDASISKSIVDFDSIRTLNKNSVAKFVHSGVITLGDSKKFNPTKLLSRAQLSIWFDRLEWVDKRYLAQGNLGTFQSLSKQTMTVMMPDRTSKTFTVSQSVKAFGNEATSGSVLLSSLKPGDVLEWSLVNQEVLFLRKTTDKRLALDPSIVPIVNATPIPSAKISPSPSPTLLPKATSNIVRSTPITTATPMASVTPAPTQGSNATGAKNGTFGYSGIITQIDLSKRVITINSDTKSSVVQLSIATKVTVLDGQTVLSGMEALHVGDWIFTQGTDAKVTSITLLKANRLRSEQGSIEQIYKEQLIIVRNGTSFTAYQVSKTTEITSSGKASLGVSELLPGDEIKVDAIDDALQKVTLLKRTFMMSLLVIHFDAPTMILTVMDSENRPYAIKVSKDALYYGDQAVSVLTSDQLVQALTRGKQLEVSLKDQLIVSLRLSK